MAPPFVKTIAVDLDATLAVHDKWRGFDHIGEPVPRMIERVKAAIDAGYRVVIFTARAAPGPDQVRAIARVRSWAREHGLGEVDVTAIKTMTMTEFWDDRAVRVEANTGMVGGLRDTLWAEVSE